MRITSAILFSVFLLPLLFSACKSGKEQVPPLPDPSELIAEQRMKTIREHRTLVVGFVPTQLSRMELELITELLKNTGYQFRVVKAAPETLFSFLRAGHADIICGLFTEQELKAAYLTPAVPFLELSFHILHHQEFKESSESGDGGKSLVFSELLYPDSAPETFFISKVQTKLLKRPVSAENIFKEMEQAPEKRAVFLCNISIPEHKRKNLTVRNAEIKTSSTHLFFALRRHDPELLRLLTSRFAALSQDGTVQRILEPYLSKSNSKEKYEKK